MKRISLSFLILIFILILGCSPLPSNSFEADPDLDPHWKLVFNDEFNGDEIDPEKWLVMDAPNGINNDIVYMTPDDVYVEAGNLVIRQQQRDFKGFEYTSGKVNTMDRFSFKYGRVELRAKPPAGVGFHTAYWLMMADCTGTATGNRACIWPPEIGLGEVLGQTPDSLWVGYHYGYPNHQSTITTHYPNPYVDLTDDFHTYAFEWFPGEMFWYLDGELIKHNTEHLDEIAQYNMLIILDTAIGGNWPDPPNDQTPFPSFNRIDYVRVYQWEGDFPPISTPVPTPTAIAGIKDVPRDQWIESASVGANPEKVNDGYKDAYWSTNEPQTPGQYFQVDFGSVQIFNTIELDITTRLDHYPRKFEVYVSSDGESWGDAVATGSGTPEITTIKFKAQIAQHLKIVQTGEANAPWSIADLRVFMDLAD
jgi:beta-glucanase (GH16 family)